jgi:hypothetical protein
LREERAIASELLAAFFGAEDEKDKRDEEHEAKNCNEKDASRRSGPLGCTQQKRTKLSLPHFSQKTLVTH